MRMRTAMDPTLAVSPITAEDVKLEVRISPLKSAPCDFSSEGPIDLKVAVSPGQKIIIARADRGAGSLRLQSDWRCAQHRLRDLSLARIETLETSTPHLFELSPHEYVRSPSSAPMEI